MAKVLTTVFKKELAKLLEVNMNIDVQLGLLETKYAPEYLVKSYLSSNQPDELEIVSNCPCLSANDISLIINKAISMTYIEDYIVIVYNLAKNEKTQPQQLIDIFNFCLDKIRQNVKIYRGSVDCFSVIEAILKRNELPKQIIDVVLYDNSEKFIAILAEYQLNMGLLLQFSADLRPFVRAGLARNKNLPFSYVEKLSLDDNQKVREEIAKRTDLSKEIYLRLVKDRCNEVRLNILRQLQD